jgi:hypothetical protein
MSNSVIKERTAHQAAHQAALKAALLIIESQSIKGLTRGTVSVDQAMEEIAGIIERETAGPELLEALQYAQELLKSARQYFPKSMKNSDRFQLENTNAVVGKAIAKGTAN